MWKCRRGTSPGVATLWMSSGSIATLSPSRTSTRSLTAISAGPGSVPPETRVKKVFASMPDSPATTAHVP